MDKKKPVIELDDDDFGAILMSYLKKQEKLALKVFELENNVQNTQKNLKKIVCAKTVKKKRNVL